MSVALIRRRNAQDYCEEALRRSQARDYEGALAAADQATRIAPQHAVAFHLRGSALSELGRHAEALPAFRQAIALDPALTYVQYKIALELGFLRLTDEALEAVDAAMSVNPGDLAPLILRGSLLFDSQRYEEALETFTLVLQREPGIGQVRFNRAQVLRRLGRYAEALADYDQALTLVPGLPGARTQKGIALAMAGRYDDAAAEFGAAAAAGDSRSKATADAWAAAIAWHRGDAPEARRLFQQAADQPMGTSRYESVNLRAVVSCALGDPDAAAGLLSHDADAADPLVKDVLNQLYDLLGEPPMPGIDRLRAIALRP